VSVPYRVVHRRNNAAPGIALLVAGLLILLSSALSVAEIGGGSLTLFGVSVSPGTSYDPDPVGLWFWTAAFVAGFGLILLLTRVRGLGILWRILALIPILIMGAYAGFAWYFISHPEQLLTSSDQTTQDLEQGLAQGAQALTGIHVSPGAGLIVLSAAILIGIIAIFLPSIKSEKFVPLPGSGWMPGQPGPQNPYPQQYPQYPPQQQYPQYPPQQNPQQPRYTDQYPFDQH
jgi:hypothetical protein